MERGSSAAAGEAREERMQLYVRANEAVRYARSCHANGDGDGERMALSHAVELLLDLLQLRLYRVGKGGAVEEAGEIAAPDAEPAAEPDAAQRTADSRGHNPKFTPAAKQFALLGSDGAGKWSKVDEGSASQLANAHDVSASQVYKLARTGGTSADGRWRVRPL